MLSYDGAAQPGVDPAGVRTAGTMIVALYGDLVPHAGSTRPALDAVFHDRSLAMGWLDDRSTGDPAAAAGLWAVNDAGWEHPRAADTGPVSWFQVEASAVAADRPLPVRPLLRCAQDATEWAGALRLSAVQVLLPLPGLDPSARAPYAPVPAMRTADWFAGRDPQARTAVRVHLTGVVPAVGQRLADQLAGLEQAVFRCRSGDVAAGEVWPPPLFDDEAGGDGVVLPGDLVAWSGDAIGWLAETVADCLARLGVRSPVLITAVRA